MLKSLLKKITYAVVGAAIALNAGCANYLPRIQDPDKFIYINDNFKVRPFGKLCLDLQVSQPVKKIENVPEKMRYVPIHHDDDWVPESDNGVIADDSTKLLPLFTLDFLKLGLESKINDSIDVDVYGDLGLNVSYFMPFSHDFAFGTINERNYMGAPGTDERGYGTALTYWTANYGPVLIPGINVDLSFPVRENYNFLIGGGFRSYDLKVETGWDRYNDLDKHKDYKIADIEEKSVYIGIKTEEKDRWSGIVKFGVNFNDYKKKNEEVKIHGNDTSFFVTLGAEYRF